MTVSLFIALRYWRAKSADRFGRLVTNLASAGIVLGVMALIIVLSVMNGLENHQKQQVLSHIPHAIVMKQEGNFNLETYGKELPALSHFSELQTLTPINTTKAIYQAAQ